MVIEDRSKKTTGLQGKERRETKKKRAEDDRWPTIDARPHIHSMLSSVLFYGEICRQY